MKLSPDEEYFLRHWIYDEARYRDGVGPAKRLQLEHRVTPADLATIIAAALPDPVDQEASASSLPPTGTLIWPWPDEVFQDRLAEARVTLSFVPNGITRSGREIEPLSK